MEAGFRWCERACVCHERTHAVGLKEWWAGLHLAERASEFTAAARQAGLPNELHPKFELANSMAVPNLQLRSNRTFELTSQSVVIKKAHPKL